MNNAKPIFVITLPSGVSSEDLNGINKAAQDHSVSEDYHIVVLVDRNLRRVNFQVFNIEDADDIRIEEVIQMVENTINPEQ